MFILTPTPADTELRYFAGDYHKRYGMGAIAMVPGVEAAGLWEVVEGVRTC